MRFTHDSESDQGRLDSTLPHGTPENVDVMSSDQEVGDSSPACRSKVTLKWSQVKGVTSQSSPRVKDHNDNCSSTNSARCKADMDSEHQCGVKMSTNCQPSLWKNSSEKNSEKLPFDRTPERITSLTRACRQSAEKERSPVCTSEENSSSAYRPLINRSENTPEREKENNTAKKDISARTSDKDGSPRSTPRSIVSLVYPPAYGDRNQTSVKVTLPKQTSGRSEQESEKRKSLCQSPVRDILNMETDEDVERSRSPESIPQRKRYRSQTPERNISPLRTYEREISPLRTPEREGSLMRSPERDISPVRSPKLDRDSKRSSDRSSERDRSPRRTSKRSRSSDRSTERNRSPADRRSSRRKRSISGRRSRRSSSRSSSRDRHRKYYRTRSRASRDGRVASWSSTSNRDSSASESTSRERERYLKPRSETTSRESYVKPRSESDLTSRERFLKNKAKHERRCSSKISCKSRKCSSDKTRRQMRSNSRKEEGETKNGCLRNGSNSNIKTEFRSCVRRANQLLEWSNDTNQNGLTNRCKTTSAETFPDATRWKDILSRAKKSFKNNSVSDETFFQQPPSLSAESLYRVDNPAVEPRLPPPDREFVDLCSTKQQPTCRLSAERLQSLEMTSRRAMNPLTYLEWFLAALRKLIPHTDSRMNREDFNDIHDIMDAISKICQDLADYTVFNSAAFLQLRREAYLNHTDITTPNKELLLRQTPLTPRTLFNDATRDVINKRRLPS